MRRISTAALLLSISFLTVTVRSDDPVSSSVTFNREVVRILQRKCLQCHTPGGVAMSLATYREARPWSRSIREELVEQRMPPWGAAQGYAPLKNAPGLTAREMTTLLTWLDGGLPRGDDRDAPVEQGSQTRAAHEPDQLIPVPAQRVPAYEEHVIRRVNLRAGAGISRRLQRIEFRAGDRRVLRAAFVSVMTASGRQWLGAWTPWHEAIAPPDGTAFVLPPAATLEVELHYRGRETQIEDRPAVALFFAPRSSAAAAGQIVIEPSASSTNGGDQARGTARLSQATRVWAILPQAPPPDGPAEASASVEVTARMPDGSVEVLLWIPQYHYQWPTPYVFEQPVRLPAGTTLSVTTRGLNASAVTVAIVP